MPSGAHRLLQGVRTPAPRDRRRPWNRGCPRTASARSPRRSRPDSLTSDVHQPGRRPALPSSDGEDKAASPRPVGARCVPRSRHTPLLCRRPPSRPDGANGICHSVAIRTVFAPRTWPDDAPSRCWRALHQPVSESVCGDSTSAPLMIRVSTKPCPAEGQLDGSRDRPRPFRRCHLQPPRVRSTNRAPLMPVQDGASEVMRRSRPSIIDLEGLGHPPAQSACKCGALRYRPRVRNRSCETATRFSAISYCFQPRRAFFTGKLPRRSRCRHRATSHFGHGHRFDRGWPWHRRIRRVYPPRSGRWLCGLPFLRRRSCGIPFAILPLRLTIVSCGRFSMTTSLSRTVSARSHTVAQVSFHADSVPPPDRIRRAGGHHPTGKSFFVRGPRSRRLRSMCLWSGSPAPDVWSLRGPGLRSFRG